MAENDSMQLPPDNGRTNGADSLNETQQELNSAASGEGYSGSMQQILSRNTGKPVIVDFLIGTDNIVRKDGILFLVGTGYIVLYDEKADTYTVCNLYSIQFVTFIDQNSGTLPSQVARTTLKRV